MPKARTMWIEYCRYQWDAAGGEIMIDELMAWLHRNNVRVEIKNITRWHVKMGWHGDEVERDIWAKAYGNSRKFETALKKAMQQFELPEGWKPKK
jgi:hypothetical protein